jgi:hypothetical protein
MATRWARRTSQQTENEPIFYRRESIPVSNKKSLKIPKGQSESVYRRTDNTMAKRKSTKGQTTIYKTYI